jgi:colicin import membrane protein
MKITGINSDFALSLFLHVLIIVITLIFARHSNIIKVPVPYVVTIVDSPSTSAGLTSSENKSVESGTIATPKPVDVQSSKSKSAPKKNDEGIIKERIAALEAKKKIEKMASLRKMVDIGKISAQQSDLPVPLARQTGVGSQGTKTPSSTSKTQGPAGGDYYSMVVSRIKEQWIYPESVDKELLAVVIIKIAKDGNITIDKIEKSSGNPLFDRSVLRAINKSSPLPPPQQEIEIGVRFYP